MSQRENIKRKRKQDREKLKMHTKTDTERKGIISKGHTETERQRAIADVVKLSVISSDSKQERSSVVHVEHVIDVPVPQTVEACCKCPQIQSSVAGLP